MSPRKQCIKELIKNGFILKRRGKNHDIYFNPNTKQTIPVKRHDFDENDKRYILKEAERLTVKQDKNREGRSL